MNKMKEVSLNTIFDIVYGNQLDFNKIEIQDNGINFISRSRDNLGVRTKVKKIDNKKIFPTGSLTVTLGGSYLLSTFVQQAPFYTAQNIKVLTPKKEMLDIEKYFYCYVIEKNRFRYTSHGREANTTLDTLLVPSRESIPKWVYETKVQEVEKQPLINKEFSLNTESWKEFNFNYLFKVSSSKDPLPNKLEKGKTPYVTSTEFNNGVSGYFHIKPSNSGNVLTVNRGGSVGKTFYQEKDFCATPVDVRILKPKFNLNKYIGLFLSVIIENEKYRFNYSRKMGTDKLNNLKIKLPVTPEGKPDWQFMEDYIKSLPYSRNL